MLYKVSRGSKAMIPKIAFVAKLCSLVKTKHMPHKDAFGRQWQWDGDGNAVPVGHGKSPSLSPCRGRSLFKCTRSSPLCRNGHYHASCALQRTLNSFPQCSTASHSTVEGWTHGPRCIVTALSCSSLLGDLDLLKQLSDRGVDVNKRRGGNVHFKLRTPPNSLSFGAARS